MNNNIKVFSELYQYHWISEARASDGLGISGSGLAEAINELIQTGLKIEPVIIKARQRPASPETKVYFMLTERGKLDLTPDQLKDVFLAFGHCDPGLCEFARIPD